MRWSNLWHMIPWHDNFLCKMHLTTPNNQLNFFKSLYQLSYTIFGPYLVLYMCIGMFLPKNELKWQLGILLKINRMKITSFCFVIYYQWWYWSKIVHILNILCSSVSIKHTGKKQCNEPIVIHCFNYIPFPAYQIFTHIHNHVLYPQLTNNCAWLMLLQRTHTKSKNWLWILLHFCINSIIMCMCVCVCYVKSCIHSKCIRYMWKMMMVRWDKSGCKDSFKISHNTLFFSIQYMHILNQLILLLCLVFAWVLHIYAVVLLCFAVNYPIYLHHKDGYCGDGHFVFDRWRLINSAKL